VNVDPIESDLAPIQTDSLLMAPRGMGPAAAATAATAAPGPAPAGRIAVLSSANALATHLQDTRRGRELWMTFLLAAAIALALELAVGSARTLRA
jgi:hypothetical protein